MSEKTTTTKRPKNSYIDRSTQPLPTTFPPQATAREREKEQTKTHTWINRSTRPLHIGRRKLAGQQETVSDSQVGFVPSLGDSQVSCIEVFLDSKRRHRTVKWASLQAHLTVGDGIRGSLTGFLFAHGARFTSYWAS